jgi:UDP-glucose 4-epimerase
VHRPTIPASTNCLVLGGGGFIGTHLCRGLLQRGAVVEGFGRRQAFPAALRGVKWTSGEFTDRAALARVVEGQEIVFLMLGGSMPEGSNKDPVADLMSSTVATLHLLELCRASAVRKLVFVSSGGTVYGIPQQTPIPESARTDPISAYGISKLATEKYLHLYWYLHGLDYAVLRVANPFGPYQIPGRRQGVVAALLHRVLQDQPVEIWGDGRVVRDFLYVGDVVEALIAVSGYAGEQRVFNVGCGVGRSILAVIEDIGKTLGRTSVRKLHKPGRATDVPVNVLDITRIRQELGWAPTTAWDDALRMTAEWIAQNL